MSLLNQFLKKIGASSVTELNTEERNTYKQWEEALSGRKLTDADVADFLSRELEDAVTKVTKMRLGDKDDTFLKMKIDFISACKKFLSSPEMEKQMTEAAIKQML